MTNKNEKDLYSPIPSITAAPPAADRNAEQRDEEKKRPAPRANKPEAYYLMRDGALESAYDNAADAIKGLKNEPMHHDEKLWLRDEHGEKLAAKTLVEVDNTTNPMQASHSEVRLELTEDMRHDLAAEGFDPDRAAEIDVQIEERRELTWRDVMERGVKAPDVELETPHDMPKERAADLDSRDTKTAPEFQQLAEAMRDMKEAKNQFIQTHSEQNWRALLGEAMQPETPPPIEQQQSEFRVWLQEVRNEQSQPTAQAEQIRQLQQASTLNEPDIR